MRLIQANDRMRLVALNHAGRLRMIHSGNYQNAFDIVFIFFNFIKTKYIINNNTIL